MNLSRVAAKQLTASDLSLFASFFHKSEQKSKQKGINLNGDVFVRAFYPGLRDRRGVVRFGLSILGPGGAAAYTGLSRKVLNENEKNWRLNGELISDPAEEPGRFQNLAHNDIAIMAFEGESEPEQVTMLLVSAVDDAKLHHAIRATCGFHGRETMKQLTEEMLRTFLATTENDYESPHPLQEFLSVDSVEDALYGSFVTQESVAVSDGRGRQVSSEVIQRQTQAAAETGQDGEERFRDWLLNTGHLPEEFEWVSSTHARAAYDFEVFRSAWEAAATTLYVDVKSTRGPHGSAIHMSYAELRWAAKHTNYRIARLSNLTPTAADVVVLSGVSEKAQEILAAIGSGMPNGVKVMGVQLSPDVLTLVHKDRYEGTSTAG